MTMPNTTTNNAENPSLDPLGMRSAGNDGAPIAEGAGSGRSGRSLPPVLDVCCGSRMMWFDRKDARAIYVDKRRETWQRPPCETHPKGGSIVVEPDIVADFTSLPFPDESFWHVVFDPPHFVRSGEPGFLAKTYGWLPGDWEQMLQGGFAECFRVLRPGGTLIFKWCDTDTPLRKVLALTPERPLYGHKTGAKARTHWVAFLKGGGGAEQAGDGTAEPRGRAASHTAVVGETPKI